MPKNNQKIDKFNQKLTEIAKKCPTITNVPPVLGVGPVPCKVVIVGEAPGSTETKEGRPFIGRAGVLLTSALEDVFKCSRDELYITNVVKLWPNIYTEATGRYKTRTPSRAEQDYFLPYLLEELSIVKPKAVIAVGKTAYAALIDDIKANPFVPGVWVEGQNTKVGLKVMPVYHPAYLLRKQNQLIEMTKDLKKALKEVLKEV